MPAPQVAVLQMQRPGFCAVQAPIFDDVTCGRALSRKPAMSCAALRAGLALSIRPATPDASAVEKLLPKMRL